MSKGTEDNNMTEETMDADESLMQDEETDMVNSAMHSKKMCAQSVP